MSDFHINFWNEWPDFGFGILWVSGINVLNLSFGPFLLQLNFPRKEFIHINKPLRDKKVE